MKLSQEEKPKYIADFETTVDDNPAEQKSTEVWSWALVKTDMPDEPESVVIGNSLETFLQQLETLGTATVYFHNLKFDGTFILYELCRNPKYRDHLVSKFSDSWEVYDAHDDADFLKHAHIGEYTYLISDMGVWYSIKIKTRTGIVTILDSLKIIPLSVAEMGKAFNTQHRKLEMEYKGERHAGGTITDEEKAYIANDVLVVKEALNFMWSEGHTKSTIGSCCMAEYKEEYDKKTFKEIFPDMTQIEVDDFGNVDKYIRKSYKGGYCYVKKPGVYRNGTTVDVNSLYPSVMHSDSGNVYPTGKPHYFKGEPDWEKLNETYANGQRKYYYFIRVKCRFNLKSKKLPTLQIKGNYIYRSNEWLSTSDYTDSLGGRYASIEHPDGTQEKIRPELVLCMTDYWLLMDHYDVEDLEYIDGLYFRAYAGLFDDYINKYAEMKKREKGGKRTISKLFLNNLYGKFSTSPDSSYQLATLDEEGNFVFKTIREENRKPVYIPVGSAVTGYARYFTITHAQANYDNFIYADTDSLHCTCTVDELKDIEIHPTNFLCWKAEAEWDKAVFVRQKTYIEHVIKEDQEACEPYYSIKCAGMGKEAKKIVDARLEKGSMTLADFKPGFTVSGNLKAHRIKGGTLLVDSDFKLR